MDDEHNRATIVDGPAKELPLAGLAVRADRREGDRVVWLRPATPGLEVLHAYFRNHVYAKHAHEGVTLALVDSGAAAFTCAGDKYIVAAGGAFVINAEEPHTGRAATRDGYRYRVIYAQPDLLWDSGQQTPPEPCVVFANHGFVRLLARAQTVVSQATSRLRQESALLALGRALGGDRQTPRTRADPGTQRTIASRARDYLDAHLAEDVSMRDLSLVRHGMVRHTPAGPDPGPMGLSRHVRWFRRAETRRWRARGPLVGPSAADLGSPHPNPTHAPILARGACAPAAPPRRRPEDQDGVAR